MRQRLFLLVVVASVGGLAIDTRAQISIFPYLQNFDSVQPPSLPVGWNSTRNRDTSANDFATSTTNPASPPHAVGSTNARITQALFSPLFSFAAAVPDTLSFRVARSSTHTARMLVEASIDSGRTFSIQVGDSIRYPGTTAYVLVKLGLPQALLAQSSVQFRWRIVGDPTAGTSATLRIDDIAIRAFAADDLSLSAVRFQPASPVEGDSVLTIAKIINVGQQSAQNFSAEFYVDANNDSIPQPSELRAVVPGSGVLAVRDSVELAARIGPFAAGAHLMIVRVVYPPDQNVSNNQRLAPLTVGYRGGSIVVNEIMYAPTSPEPEWVELYNTRADSISVKNWFIADSSRTQRRITTEEVKIPPAGYTLLTGNPSALLNIHPSITSTIIGISSFPSLNNSGDAVILYDHRGAVMDSVRYLPGWGGNTGGRSLERIDHSAPSILQSNWGTSRSTSRSTPGERNSLSRKDRDLALDSIAVQPLFPLVGDTVRFMAKVRNPGREIVPSFVGKLFEDVNGDSLAQPSELIRTLSYGVPLQPLDSTLLTFSVPNLQAGVRLFIVQIVFGGDEDTTNNVRARSVSVGYPAGSVVINEIMYAPPTGVPEWVELLNTRSDTVDLTRWLIGNRSTSSRYQIAANRLSLAPGEHLVLTKDTALLRVAYPTASGNVVQVASLPTFLWNNSGDAVVVLDNRRLIMDSVMYSSTWGGTGGRSLERIDPLDASNDSTNWTTSGDSLGATPARVNSYVVMDHDLRVRRLSSDTVAPGRNAHLTVVIQNVGRMSSSSFELLLFNDADGDSVGAPNELFFQQSVTQTLARRDSIILHVEWQNPASGSHTVLAQVSYPPDQRLANNRAFVSVRVGFPEKALVINEIMYAPLTGAAEYVEVVNIGSVTVDVNGWKIRDRATSGGANVYMLAKRARLIQPNELFVLASDSSILRLFPGLDTLRLTIANQSSLSLNNDGDDVVLIDPTGFVVDSVTYLPAWHNPNVRDVTGRSLEKINPFLASNDSRNWTTCTQPIGGTPGHQNSVYAPTLPEVSKIAITPNPFSPDGDGREDFAVIQYELPLSVSVIRVRIYDAVGRLIRTLANNEPAGARGSIVWDGLDDEKRKARVGVYIVLLEAIADGGGVIETAKAALVVAAKL
jgi:hypothetical protein